MTTAPKHPKAQPCLATPRKGHVLSTIAEYYGSDLRQAVVLLRAGLGTPEVAQTWHHLYAVRLQSIEDGAGRPIDELAAWQIVAIWAVGVAAGILSTQASLQEAEAWFLGCHGAIGLTSLVQLDKLEAAEACLRRLAEPKAYAELLPYVLDPHGQASRLSVRARPETIEARRLKKDEGVFYTPRDVADFMVEQTLDGLQAGTIPRTVFDPACGTGVFLRSILTALHARTPNADIFDLACSSLYGTDIDAWALNASTFVLWHVCSSAITARGIPPVSAWHALRLNLAQQDALELDPGRQLPSDAPTRIARLECRAALKVGALPQMAIGDRRGGGVMSFEQLYPEIASGPRLVIGNPPYADIGQDRDLLAMTGRFETLRAAPRPTSDMYPLFLEQMVRLTAPDAHGGAMVLPLSIACSTGKQFTALRSLIAKTPGHWRFAFFDREPHALFGEDVKTRNAIVIWTRESEEHTARLSTGPLRKWRAEGRARMFKALDFTPISANIGRGIPKVSGPNEAVSFELLQQEGRVLEHFVPAIGRALLQDALAGDDKTVYVGATAYNFLNVFVGAPRWEPGGAALTEHPLHALHCASRTDALCVYALLSSRLAYWWWHVNGDGFHVSRGALGSVPVGPLLIDRDMEAKLAELGLLLWAQVQATPVVSVNRGRTSLAYSSNSYEIERCAVDKLLLNALGLAPEFLGTLKQFMVSVTSAEMSVAHAFDQDEGKTGT